MSIGYQRLLAPEIDVEDLDVAPGVFADELRDSVVVHVEESHVIAEGLRGLPLHVPELGVEDVAAVEDDLLGAIAINVSDEQGGGFDAGLVADPFLELGCGVVDNQPAVRAQEDLRLVVVVPTRLSMNRRFPG